MSNIFIDIDETLCTGYLGESVEESIRYHRQQGIEIPPDATRYADFFALPDMVRIREAVPGALDGVKQLTQIGNVMYATVRAEDLEEITRVWLREHGFPVPERVIFCRKPVEKLLAIAEYAGPLVLIDDRWRILLTALERNREHPVISRLLGRLTLVAFGATQADLPEASIVPVASFPDWSFITDALMLAREVVKKG